MSKHLPHLTCTKVQRGTLTNGNNTGWLSTFHPDIFRYAVSPDVPRRSLLVFHTNLTGVFLPLSGRDAKIFRLQGILVHKLNKNNVPDAFTPYQYMHIDHSNTSQLARLVLAQGTSLLLRHLGLFTN